MNKANAQLRFIVNADGAVILDTRRGKISTLNATGAYVWQALDRGEAVESIVANLVRETGESVHTLEQDVREFVGALNEKGLLVR